ncbi:DUF4345 domain-containing protein [Sphingobacterium deserti]|uniref:DUF4345 domain-containing protein n=1 Tax=Sphingobacterium deserti TaxID=1229276 RepID=A0A0B8T6F0_9SPHI|nr:DUF4345 domain-containing protein [Sphingobacterium deserti]KGE12750.1 hypothetical protein DI53_3489 [Sphingobacterium deserti]
MQSEQSEKILLTIAAIGLVPIALSYGFMPEKTLTPLYGIDVANTNLKHIMRAVTGLYVGQIVIWLLGATRDNIRKPALFCLVIFMLGLASGRAISFLVEGAPHWMLIVYFILELALGIIGLTFIVRQKNEKPVAR